MIRSPGTVDVMDLQTGVMKSCTDAEWIRIPGQLPMALTWHSAVDQIMAASLCITASPKRFLRKRIYNLVVDSVLYYCG